MSPDENIYDVEDEAEEHGEPIGVPDGAQVEMLPPHIFLLHLMAGIVLSWLIPIHFGHGWGGLGLIFFAGAFGVMLWCRKLFQEAETNIRPGQPTTVIIQTGPYKYSRNPIYVAFLVGFAGLAMMADAPVMLLLLGPLYYILDRKVIAPEEEYLAAKFGEEYTDYQDTVRRWV
jgi:protein-S-isoprenylcysteine O-methyltransferase Ste14